MNISFNERIRLNAGIDRKINEWQLIDVHLIPKNFQQNHEVDFYCSDGEGFYLLRIRKRKNNQLTIEKDKQNLTTPIYLVAEYNFQTLNDKVLEKILTEFSQLLQG